MTKIYVVDGDQLSIQGTKRICSYVAQHPSHVGIVAHNNGSAYRNDILKRFRTHGVINIVTPSFKNSADFALAALLSEVLCKTKCKTPKVIVVSNDKALIWAVNWLCQRHFLRLERLDPKSIC
ncbi:hypothetical protein [Vibrio mediterranei]|uniref:hypothetical protein n=1 Tax=Vibrio mediterranei TaxID=689 RepID=UPI004067F3CA